MAASRMEYLVAFFGVQKRRAILVPLNVELKGEFLRHQIRNCQPQVIITDRDLFPDLKPGDLELTRLVIQVGEGFELATDLTCHSFDELERAPEQATAVLRPQVSDVCLIIYTSGTSGAAKGVELTQCHSYLFGLQQAQAMQLDERDTYYVCLPLFHVNALLMSLAGCLVAGANAYVAQRFSASRWRRDLSASGASVTNMLGTMAEFLLALAPEASDTDHNVTRVMALPVSSSWAPTFEKRFGIKLVQVYGMTECNIVAYTSTTDPLAPGRVGAIQRGFFDVEIMDPQTGEPLRTNQIGEICVRPKVPSGFMRGYHNMPEVTVTAWRGLWFHTGDAGRIDESDALHFVDRLGDTIRRRGENISSFEIEQAILEHPRVLECAVVGVRVDGAGGEQEIKVDLALDQSVEKFDDADFFAWCAERIPRYAVPRFVELHSSLPKTATGKVQKVRLREAGVTPRTWDRQAVGLAVSRTHSDDVSQKGWTMETLLTGYGLLEGPVWDADRGLIFADTANGGVYLLGLNQEVTPVALHRRGIGGVVRHRDGGIIVSGRNVAYKGGGLDAATTVLVDQDESKGLIGFNDMAADRAGRLYVGALGFRPTATALSGIGGDSRTAPLMLLDLDGTTRVVQHDVKLSNGLSFSPDGDTLYHADSGDQTIYRYDVDADGSLHERRPFAQVSRGLPDGLATTLDGDIWVAIAHGGKVIRLSPEGSVHQEIEFPVPMVTSLCFGGPDMMDLFVVCGSDGTGRSDAGSVFKLRSEVAGTAVGVAAVPWESRS